MRTNRIFLATIAGSLLAAGAVHATPINITIHDNHSASGYIGTGVGLEDNETEPGTIQSDAWDYEAFGYDAVTKGLDVIGTFDFKNGQTVGNRLIRSGAIFVGTGSTMPGPNGWAYAYVLDFNNNTYSLYSSFNIVLPTDIVQSSPWTITPTAGAFGYLTGLANPDGFGLGVMGSNPNIHRMINLPLTDLPTSVLNDFWVHTTPECGNDNLNGRYQRVPDASSTAVLLGIGVGVAGVIRRKYGRE